MNPSPLLFLLGSILILAPITQALAQSSFVLRNRYPPQVDAPVFDSNGSLLFGDQYRAELWGGPTPTSLTPAFLELSTERAFAPFYRRGYFTDPFRSVVTIFSVGSGAYAWLQVRVWDTTVGATYEEAYAKGIGGYGESELFYAKGGFTSSGVPGSPSDLVGLKSFSILPVIPEPSPALLSILGSCIVGCGLLIQRERRRIGCTTKRQG